MRITVDSRSYQAYINSPAWEAKRRQALKTHGRFCRGCGRAEVSLHVHHRTYERLGDEQPQDLVILCGVCHAGVHQLTQSGLTLETATDKVIESKPVERVPLVIEDDSDYPPPSPRRLGRRGRQPHGHR